MSEVMVEQPTSPARSAARAATEAAGDTLVGRTAARLRWWHEVLIIAAFYLVYSGVRNLFGSASVTPQEALRNAERIIELERSLGIFHEESLQRAFLGSELFIRFWNIFYGTFHFAVTIFTLLFLFLKVPNRYRVFRNTLAFTTGFALIGFSLFPLMPPRLLNICGGFGGCAGTSFSFVDTLHSVGGLWSFESETMKSISNQYAAMPSLHFAWSMWCLLALYPVLRNRIGKVAIFLYPWATTFAIVVTANHYVIDAVGGALVLAFGYLAGRSTIRLSDRVRRWRHERSLPTIDLTVEEPVAT